VNFLSVWRLEIRARSNDLNARIWEVASSCRPSSTANLPTSAWDGQKQRAAIESGAFSWAWQNHGFAPPRSPTSLKGKNDRTLMDNNSGLPMLLRSEGA
jgi:hypothetical protein